MNRRQFFLAGAGLAAGTSFSASGASGQQPRMQLSELYNPDMSFTPYALEHEGQRVAVEGFMAPLLMANTNFYVLTSRPVAICPFCEEEDDWPDDILAVYAQRVIDAIPPHIPIVTRGVLELGTYVDPKWGFLSRVRLVDAVQEPA